MIASIPKRLLDETTGEPLPFLAIEQLIIQTKNNAKQWRSKHDAQKRGRAIEEKQEWRPRQFESNGEKAFRRQGEYFVTFTHTHA